MRISSLAALVASSFLAAGCGGAHLLPVPPAYRTGFTGTWILNRDLSTSMTLGGEARGVADGRGGEMGGGRYGDEDGEGREGRFAPGGHVDSLARKDLMRTIEAAPRMDLTLRDSTVTLQTGRFADERVTARLDDKTVEVKLPDGHKLRTKARFEGKNDVLVIDRSIAGSGSVEEKFRLTPGKDRIIVDIDVSEGPRGGRTLRHVYDREKS